MYGNPKRVDHPYQRVPDRKKRKEEKRGLRFVDYTRKGQIKGEG